MCVAICCSKGTRLSEEQLSNGWDSNRDGAGFAFVDETNKVVIKKGFLEKPSFIEEYLKYSEKYAEDSPFLVHMRIRTSGTVSVKNCHPFKIKGGAMIHNGIMFTPTGERAGTEKDRKSDTRVFTEALYNILALEDIKRARKNIEEAVGWGNKLAFLYDNKETFIINEDQGKWDQGIWFSNNSCSAGSRYWAKGAGA